MIVVVLFAGSGATWNRTFWMPGTSTTQYSIMELRYTTDNDVWALGSELGELFPSTSSLLTPAAAVECRV